MNRKLSITFLLVSAIFIKGCHSKKHNSWVTDNANILTSVQVSKLDSLYQTHEKKTSNEIVLITLPNFDADSSILEAAAKMGNKYGVGKKESNNGVVILLCPSSRQVAIATGIGTERFLTDSIAQEIIDKKMIPRFKEGHFFEGIFTGSKEITYFLELPQNLIRRSP